VTKWTKLLGKAGKFAIIIKKSKKHIKKAPRQAVVSGKDFGGTDFQAVRKVFAFGW
jgi:hypothetical protein